MRILLSGTPSGYLSLIPASYYAQHCGMLTSWAYRMHPKFALRLSAPWAMDNNAYSGFDADKFEDSLEKYQGVPGCLFTVSPDVVGDAISTLSNFDQWHERIKSRGYPIALAIQNGQEHLAIPWRDLDAIFIGGDTKYKFTEYVAELVIEAHARGKHCHMGRVNSVKRWRYCKLMGFDSTDGSGTSIDRSSVRYAMAVLGSQEHAKYDWRPHVPVLERKRDNFESEDYPQWLRKR